MGLPSTRRNQTTPLPSQCQAEASPLSPVPSLPPLCTHIWRHHNSLEFQPFLQLTCEKGLLLLLAAQSTLAGQRPSAEFPICLPSCCRALRLQNYTTAAGFTRVLRMETHVLVWQACYLPSLLSALGLPFQTSLLVCP